MQIAPRAKLEAFAREQYAKAFTVAPPKVRNAVAVVALGEHRAFRWRGHRYTVPALPWHEGMVLLGCREVLREPHSPLAERARALRNASRTARPMLRAPRRPWHRPFKGATASDVLELVDRLLYVPDEAPNPPAPGTKAVDLLDGLAEYMRSGWPTTPDGLPASWAHYQYCLRDASRHAARETLRLAQATRMAQPGVSKEDWRAFTAELQNAGGW